MSYKYHPNDVFYFFTDGITDQFGGQNSKKLMKRGLLEFLDKLANMPILKREVELDLFLRKWQGSLEQTDDMLFMRICPQTFNSKYEKTVNQELAYKSANQPYFLFFSKVPKYFLLKEENRSFYFSCNLLIKFTSYRFRFKHEKY